MYPFNIKSTLIAILNENKQKIGTHFCSYFIPMLRLCTKLDHKTSLHAIGRRGMETIIVKRV